MVKLPKDRLWPTQISRLQKRRMISIISDSAKVAEIKKRSLDRKKELAEAQAKLEAKKTKTEVTKKVKEEVSAPKVTETTKKKEIDKPQSKSSDTLPQTDSLPTDEI